MYGYQNEAGEPIMDGAAYRYEQYLDSTYTPDEDYDLIDYYDRDEPDQIDPKVCPHAGDASFPQDAGMSCEDCWETYEGPRMVSGALDWPVFMSRERNRY